LSRFRVIALDEIEALPGPASLTWRPGRRTLGFRAFGTNAYTAENAGDDVVEPHTEDDHEELYFVFRGRARFILDGEEVEVPAGSYVHLPEPKVHRHAVALEPGTTVMSFGGPPAFAPSEWEERFVLWGEARLAARSGDRETALARLRELHGYRPGEVAEARDHPDFASLRDDPDFVALVTR
jgi:quercetin dioxygenase-like cupin family protein